VHKATVCVATAESGRGGEVREVGVFENRKHGYTQIAPFPSSLLHLDYAQRRPLRMQIKHFVRISRIMHNLGLSEPPNTALDVDATIISVSRSTAAIYVLVKMTF